MSYTSSLAFRHQILCLRHTETPLFLSMHAKSLVIDDEISYIGSYNLDPRSRWWNTEVGIVIYDPEFAQKLRRDIERDMHPRNSYLVGARRNPLATNRVSSLMHGFSEKLPIRPMAGSLRNEL